MKKRLYCFLCLLFTCILFCSCSKAINYNDYISESRENAYYCEQDGLRIKIYTGERETPYCNDGIKGSVSPLTEVFVYANETKKSPSISLTIEKKTYGGELNYDQVKKAYTFSESIVCRENSIAIELNYDENTYRLTAESKHTTELLSNEKAIEILSQKEEELFKSLTDGNYFNGELSVRFLFDDKPYFYVAVTEKSGKITALLLDATSGEVLAKKILNG